MKYKLLLIVIAFICFSCKSNEAEKTTETKVPEEKTLTIAEEIAKAHGYEHWNTVKQIEFTFGVEREGKSGRGRHWKWNPKSDDITLTTTTDTITYNRKSIDSLSLNADKAFINDKFWLLIPFQLVWDQGTTISEPRTEIAPLSKKELNKITLLYSNEGGYTPGDAYDIYYDNDYMIREWVFREANTEEASLTNTFEGYNDYNGLIIATDHKKDNGNWNLKLENIKVITE